MRLSHMIQTIDTHTAGNPTRNVVAGFPAIHGQSMPEKMAYAKEHYSHLITSLMLEPRGHSNMSGTIWVPPCNPEAHMGILFIDAGGLMPMCGHSTIGCVTAMLETGAVEPSGDVCDVNIDTPAGLVRTRATIKDGKVTRVAFRNVPSFLFCSGTVDVPGIGPVPYDVAYGGNTYAITDAKYFPGLQLRSGFRAEIEKAAQAFGGAVRAAVKFQHPEKPFLNVITHVMFSTQPDDPAATYRNTVVFLPDSLDRSPCGTGTSARVASLFAKGELKLGETFVHESVIGTQFTARIVEPATVGSCKGGIPEVEGTAYLTGFHKFVIDPEDKLKWGFRLD